MARGLCQNCFLKKSGVPNKKWVLLEEGVAEFWHGGLRKLDLVSSCLREE